jgi:DNA primase small subunit
MIFKANDKLSYGSSEGGKKLVRAEGTASDIAKHRNYVTLRRIFREYYFRHGKRIECPREISRREFGIRYFAPNGEPGRMIRHLTFKSEGEVRAAAIREMPSDLYCSNAYYNHPSYPMQEKEWLGADLIFDIDAKDLLLPCQASHSYLICESCLHAIKGREGSDRCHLCGSQNVILESIPCKVCFDSTKKEVRKLLNVLIDDFGINDKSIQIYFSGNEGFHLYVTDTNFLNLDAQARLDISGYILGKGMMPEIIGVYRRPKGVEGKTGVKIIHSAERTPGRASRGPNFHGTKPKTVDEINDKRDFLVKLSKDGPKYGWQKRLLQELEIEHFSDIRLKNIVQQKGGYNGFKAKLDEIGKKLGINIDPQVTMDVHRIFRLPGTLNSKSGLAKIKCSDLQSFDPLSEACLLGDDIINIRSHVSIKFILREKEFYVDEKAASLPAYAAIYLICKRLAMVAGE